jgi:predicted PurR-regulated permease PerM
VAGPADPDAPSPESVEEAEVLQASIKAGSVAQIVVAVIAVLGLIYVLKLVLITTLTSLLLAFLLEPLASSLGRIGLPRWAGALLSVLLMMALALCLTFFFYSRAVDFATALPNYSGKIRDTLSNLRSQ